MTNQSRTGLLTDVVIVAVFFLVGLCPKAQAQSPVDYEEKRGLVYFKMGGNSTIASSLLDSNFNLGFGGGYQFSNKVSFFVEPSLVFNWPKKEMINYEGYPLRVSASTVLVDVNGAYVVRKFFIQPYVTGGVGLLMNSANLTDGYSRYTLGSDTHFTKNVGGGLRVFLGESLFVGGEAKQYFVKDNKFRTFSGIVGFTF